eukprot:3505423-Prymnesium_polylepis.1
MLTLVPDQGAADCSSVRRIAHLHRWRCRPEGRSSVESGGAKIGHRDRSLPQVLPAAPIIRCAAGPCLKAARNLSTCHVSSLVMVSCCGPIKPPYRSGTAIGTPHSGDPVPRV